MKRFVLAALMACNFVSAAASKPLEDMFPDIAKQVSPDGIAALQPLDFKQGHISIGGGLATLDLGEDFYYLDPEDASYVLTTLWGNPPDRRTIGMIFPATATPFDDAWGINLYFFEIGHVVDDGAENYDFDQLLRTMQEVGGHANTQRQQNNISTVTLVGWASEPHYDKKARRLAWAKELLFEGDPKPVVNYNVRILGRRGVLAINAIADLERIEEIAAIIPQILDIANFSAGQRYADFDASIDRVATIGIADLIAGDTLEDSGLAAALLALFKKIWLLLLLPLLWAPDLIRRRKRS